MRHWSASISTKEGLEGRADGRDGPVPSWSLARRGWRNAANAGAISALGRVQAAVDATAAELAILDGKQPLVGQEVLQLTAAATAARERMASGPFRQLSAAKVEARRSLLAELC